MTLGSGVFLGALVLVVALQVAHRLLGSVAAVVWCLAAGVWGYLEIQDGRQLHFFGIQSDVRLFVPVMAAFAGYNALLAVRELKRRRS